MKYGYGWVLKLILAALLLGVGIYLQFDRTVVYTITGVIIILFSIIRVVPLLKSLNKEVLRTINLIEIIFDTILGIILVYIAVSGEVNNQGWQIVYRFGLAFFFYVRGLVYLTSTTFFNEKSEVPKFFVHIGAITLGTIIAVLDDFSPETVALFLLVVALIGSIYLSYDGYNGYKRYRTFQIGLNSGKQKEKVSQKEIEKKKDVILDEQDEERPYVN